jgi:tetrahydromethanopterin S-methyltransferase subunit F
MAQQVSSVLTFDNGRGDAGMQTLSDRHTTQIFGLAMGAVFAAMLILNALSY